MEQYFSNAKTSQLQIVEFMSASKVIYLGMNGNTDYFLGLPINIIQFTSVQVHFFFSLHFAIQNDQ